MQPDDSQPPHPAALPHARELASAHTLSPPRALSWGAAFRQPRPWLYLTAIAGHQHSGFCLSHADQTRVELTGDHPEELKDLIRKMLIKNPKERIKLLDILSHPWLKSAPDHPADQKPQ